MSAKEIVAAGWKKASLAFLKSFRGLICEKKDGGWELSLGRVAFWFVFSHCMFIWNKVGDVTKTVLEPVEDTAAAAATAATETGVTERVVEVAESVIKFADVSQSELYVLFALLGYAGVKITSEMIQGFASAWKNGKPT